MVNMPKVRLYTCEALVKAATPALEKQQQHYLSNVMRKKVGDLIRVFNGVDGEWVAKITNISKRQVEIEVQDRLREQVQCIGPILAFAPTKNDNTSLVVQKATELGVSALIGVYTERTVPNKVHLDKWRTIVIEASEQCERLCVPGVHEAVRMAELPIWCADNNIGMAIVADPYAEVDLTAMSELASAPGRHLLLIGPEGGFSVAEIEALRACGFYNVRLGSHVLRAETAAMAALVAYNIVARRW